MNNLFKYSVIGLVTMLLVLTSCGNSKADTEEAKQKNNKNCRHLQSQLLDKNLSSVGLSQIGSLSECKQYSNFCKQRNQMSTS